jgi:3-hydroxypropanoate dehydrogenase
MARLDDSALDQLFRTARTYNGYTDEPVTLDELDAIWELMKFGPTSANCLPARLVWLTTPEAKERLAKHASESNAGKIRKAPVSVVIGMDMEFHEKLPELFPHTDARSWFAGNSELIEKTAFRNSSLQGAYFIMAARALGLDTEFFAGTPVKSNFISTLGHGDPSTIFGRSPRPGFERFNTVL